MDFLNLDRQDKLLPVDRPSRKQLYLAYGSLFCLRGALDYAYSHLVSVIFGYQNFKNDPSTFSYLISWVFLITLSPLIVKTFQKNNLSSYIMTMLVITSLLPTSTLIGYNQAYAFNYVLLMYLYWLLLLLLNLKLPTLILAKNSQIKSNIPYVVLTVLFCASVLYTSGKYTGFRFHFGLLDVYDVRSEARLYDVPTILGYLITAADNILPVLLVYFLIQKSRVISAIIVVIILLNFGISAVKQVLFLLIFALIGYFFVKSAKFFRYFVWGVFVLVLLSVAEFAIFETYSLTNFATYRIFFIPAKLHYVYYNFFSVNEFDYFRQSALKWLLDSPYKDNIQFIMGDQDIGDFSARANNGLFTDAYLNFGPAGVIFFPAIVVLILKSLEGAAKGLSPKILFIVNTAVSFVLLGVPFTTALLTSGIFVMIVFLYTLPRNPIASPKNQM